MSPNFSFFICEAAHTWLKVYN